LSASRQAVLDAVDVGTVQAVVRRIAEMALAGDLSAAQVYLGYAVGKPTIPPADPHADALGELILSKYFDDEPPTSKAPEDRPWVTTD
jgi:hypothetical protein